MASKDIFADYIVYLRVALAMLLFVRHSLSVAVSHGSANLLASRYSLLFLPYHDVSISAVKA